VAEGKYGSPQSAGVMRSVFHKTLRVIPAMAAGVSDRAWSLEEIAVLAN
jgi:hypothetical protein